MEAYDAAPVISSIAMADLAAGSVRYQDPISNLITQIANNNNGSDILSLWVS